MSPPSFQASFACQILIVLLRIFLIFRVLDFFKFDLDFSFPAVDFPSEFLPGPSSTPKNLSFIFLVLRIVHLRASAFFPPFLRHSCLSYGLISWFMSFPRVSSDDIVFHFLFRYRFCSPFLGFSTKDVRSLPWLRKKNFASTPLVSLRRSFPRDFSPPFSFVFRFFFPLDVSQSLLSLPIVGVGGFFSSDFFNDVRYAFFPHSFFRRSEIGTDRGSPQPRCTFFVFELNRTLS